MLKTERKNHTVYRIAYHLCWIPKYRKEIFKSNLQERMKEMLLHIAFEYEWDVEEIEVMSDHVHILISVGPKWSPARIVQILKSKSAIQFFRENPEIRKRYFWGGKLWTSSYFVETVGNSNHEMVKKYIEEQEQELQRRLAQAKLF